MKIRLSDNNTPNVVEIDPDQMAVLLTSVFNGVTFMTNDNEALTVCMRESGYELIYTAGEMVIEVTLNDGQLGWGVL